MSNGVGAAAFATETGSGTSVPSTRLKMNAAELETLINKIKTEDGTIKTEIATHERLVSELSTNPHMIGSIRYANEVMIKANSAYQALHNQLVELVRIIQVATLKTNETEEKFKARFMELAGDGFTTDATLDNIQPV